MENNFIQLDDSDMDLDDLLGEYNQPDLKAYENKTNANGEPRLEAIGDRPTDHDVVKSTATTGICEHYQKCLTEAVIQTLHQMISAIAMSSTRQQIIAVAKKVSDCCVTTDNVCKYIEKPLWSLFDKNPAGLSMSVGREYVWKRLHSVRLDKEFTSGWLTIIQKHVEGDSGTRIGYFFIQSFLQNVVPILLRNMSDKH